VPSGRVYTGLGQARQRGSNQRVMAWWSSWVSLPVAFEGHEKIIANPFHAYCPGKGYGISPASCAGE